MMMMNARMCHVLDGSNKVIRDVGYDTALAVHYELGHPSRTLPKTAPNNTTRHTRSFHLWILVDSSLKIKATQA